VKVEERIIRQFFDPKRKKGRKEGYVGKEHEHRKEGVQGNGPQYVPGVNGE